MRTQRYKGQETRDKLQIASPVNAHSHPVCCILPPAWAW